MKRQMHEMPICQTIVKVFMKRHEMDVGNHKLELWVFLKGEEFPNNCGQNLFSIA